MKRLYFLFLTILLSLSFSCTVFAQSNISMTYDEWINYIDDVENDPNLVSQVLRLLGFAVSDAKFLQKIPVATIKDLMGIPADTTIKDWFKDNSTPSDNDKPVLNHDLNDGLKAVENYYVENNPMYGYTFTLTEISSRISYAQVYTALQNYIDQTSDVMGKIFFVNLAGTSTKVWSIDPGTRENDKLYVTIGGTGQGANYKYTSGYLSSLNSPNSYPSYTGVEYNSSTQSFEPSNSDIAGNRFYYLLDKPTNSVSVPSQTFYIVSRNARIPFRIFSSVPSAADYMYQEYYYNTDTWSNYQSSTGDYTLDESTINTVTYGDVVNYIDSFNTTNGYPPSITNIEKDIKQTDEDNKEDNSGGGSGSGSDDDGGSIFDWLKNLGKVLGDLIKGVGEFITEIVAGLVSALNDLLSSLSGLITDTLGSLTTVFSSIIDFVYAGLPESVKGIMMLALTVSLLITVIQLIRK